MTRAVFVAVVAILAGFLAYTAADAQINDHLHCFKIKDELNARVDVTLDGAQFGLFQDCRVKVKGRQFCVPADKLVTEPDPDLSPLPLVGEELRDDRICYKVKCPKLDPPIAPQEVSDQFGTRIVRGFKTATLCAPAVKGIEFCNDGLVNTVGEQCDGADLGGNDCTTLGFGGGTLACDGCSFDTTGCTFCPAGGGWLGVACWYLGAPGESCDDTCTAVGLTYDSTTKSYAGSGGNLAQCVAVLSALGADVGTNRGDADGCGTGQTPQYIGCFSYPTEPDYGRCPDDPTDGPSSVAGYARACACQ